MTECKYHQPDGEGLCHRPIGHAGPLHWSNDRFWYTDSTESGERGPVPFSLDVRADPVIKPVKESKRVLEPRILAGFLVGCSHESASQAVLLSIAIEQNNWHAAEEYAKALSNLRDNENELLDDLMALLIKRATR